MNWLKQANKNTYDVFIDKVYFPKELWSKEIAKEDFDFEQWKVVASSRQEAAQKIWSEHGTRLLQLMGPRKTKLPRKISLNVSSPLAGVGGLPGRLPPVLVYTGE